MNFLSHYYFETLTDDADFVMGVVLPDLIKNADKSWNLYPQKEAHLFKNTAELALLAGWKRHLEVDRLFHSSLFFSSRTSVLKQMIVPILQQGPVKPFFLAHIGLELLIDHLLVINHQVDIALFYEKLTHANSPSLRAFLDKAGLPASQQFFKYLESFLSSRYLFSYQKLENIIYAINRICMRIWSDPFTDDQLEQLTEQFAIFSESLNQDYLVIFKEIKMGLKS